MGLWYCMGVCPKPYRKRPMQSQILFWLPKEKVAENVKLQTGFCPAAFWIIFTWWSFSFLKKTQGWRFQRYVIEWDKIWSAPDLLSTQDCKTSFVFHIEIVLEHFANKNKFRIRAEAKNRCVMQNWTTWCHVMQLEGWLAYGGRPFDGKR